MKISIIGSNGFIGKNFYEQLDNIRTHKARWYQVSPDFEICSDKNGAIRDWINTDVLYVLFDGKKKILQTVSEYTTQNLSKQSKVVFAYSVDDESRHGVEISELAKLLSGFDVTTYRLPHVFGKWSSPDENLIMKMVVCSTSGKEIVLADENAIVYCSFIDDVVDELISCLADVEKSEASIIGALQNVYSITQKELLKIISSFTDDRYTLHVPRVSNTLIKALYSTYLSFFADDVVSYPLKMNVDERGSFTEFLRTHNHGQISVNISKPGIIKGQHWHNNRVEKFVIVSGNGLIQERKIGLDDNSKPFPVINHYVSADKLEVVEVRPGFTHNLINLSDTENLVSIIWGNDCFDPNHADTYFEPVEQK